MTAHDVLAPTLERLRSVSPYAESIADMVYAALALAPRRGTMREWMEAHNGELVTTVQVSTPSGDAWTPVSRVVSTDLRSVVKLSGSRREYAGMRVVAYAPSVLVVADAHHTIAYVVEAAL